MRRQEAMNEWPWMQDYLFKETKEVPNNPLFSLLIYRSAIKSDGGELAEDIEKLFRRNKWKPAWRFGIHDFPHYHSTAHEVLGGCSGSALVRFGHTDGVTTWIKEGDVVVIPAGVGHECLESTPDFLVVGGYPEGQKADMMRPDVRKKNAALERIAKLPLPEADPVYGVHGPLMGILVNGRFSICPGFFAHS